MILPIIFCSRSLETNAARHATGIYNCAYPAVAREFHCLMRAFGVKLHTGVAPAVERAP